MKFARISTQTGETYALIEDGVFALIDGDPIQGDWCRNGVRMPYDPVLLINPVAWTSKVAAVGKNYLDHLREMGSETPSAMQIFIKPSTSIIGPGEPIVRPQASRRVDFEGELAVVIGKRAKDVPAEHAHEFVFGYTVANDVTARDIQIADEQWTRGKGFDTFCPVGPVIETDFNPAGSSIKTFVNGEVRQRSEISLLIHSVPEIIAFISAAFTLLPGDIVLTGTPAGVGPLEAGDTVSVEIDGIGMLTNPVA